MATYPPVTPPNGANFTKILHSDTYPAIQVSNSAHKGRSILITGGSKGIGRSIALSFARTGASSIAIADNSTFGVIESELKEAAKSVGNVVPKILLLHLDVTDSSTITPAVKTIESNFGKLDILINNAGFMTPALSVVTSDEDTYWRTFEVNFKGVYLVTKAFLPLLLERGSEDGLKTIININSVAAHNLRLHASAYGTTKLAVLRFTEFLMAEEAGRGLLAYCVHPGAVMTTLAGAMPKETHAGLTDKPELAADTIVFLTQERRG